MFAQDARSETLTIVVSRAFVLKNRMSLDERRPQD